MELTLPAFPVPNFVLFPGCTVTLQIGHPFLEGQLELARQNGNRLCLAAEDTNVGCLAEVRWTRRNATGLAAHFIGLRRFKLRLELETDKGKLWVGEVLREPEFVGQLPDIPTQFDDLREKVAGALWLDMVAFHLPISPFAKQMLLKEKDPNHRAKLMTQFRGQQKPAPQFCLN